MISVVIPLYNKEKIIERSLKSVLSQDYDDFEVVIVNDGSTDKSVEIVKSISDPRITLIEQENGGPSKARNTGVKNAKGEWLVLLDADDELLPGALKCFYSEAICHSDADIILAKTIRNTDIKKYERKPGYIKNNFKEQALGNLGIGSGDALYRRKVFDNCKYNEKIRRNEDIDIFFRLFKNVKIYATNESTVYRNLQFSEASSARPTIYEDYVAYIDIEGSGFWEKIAKYNVFMDNWAYYPREAKLILGHLFRRWDVRLVCMIIRKIRSNTFS